MHQQIKEAFQVDNQMAQALMNATTESMFVIDTEGIILAINESVVQRLGGNPDKYIGTCIFDLFPPKVAKLRRDCLNKIVKSCRPACYKDNHDGMIFEATLHPVVDEQGEVEYVAVFGRDITEQVQATETLKTLNAQLNEKHQQLERKNIALRETLICINQEKKLIGSQVQANVDRVLLPLLIDLEAQIPPRFKNTVEFIRKSMLEITESFVNKLEVKFRKLTPREVQICRMIRNDLRSKEIGAILNISTRTVEGFRRSIRKKLGLSENRESLRTYLQSI